MIELVDYKTTCTISIGTMDIHIIKSLVYEKIAQANEENREPSKSYLSIHSDLKTILEEVRK